MVELNFNQAESDKTAGIFRIKSLLSNTDSIHSCTNLKKKYHGEKRFNKQGIHLILSLKILENGIRTAAVMKNFTYGLNVVIDKKGHHMEYSLEFVVFL